MQQSASLFGVDRDGDDRLGYVAFGATMLASAAINNIFATYYLDFFLSVVHVHQRAFYVAQTIFMVWNAVNDLIFGWLSDSMAPLRHGRRDRLPIIRRGGLGWCVAFCLVWWPWSYAEESVWLSTLNFAFVLCFYDGMLTLVELNHGALLADITYDSNKRAKYNMYSAFCAALGSFTSFFGHMFWDKTDLASFRTFALVLAFVSWACFEFTAYYLADRTRGNYGKHTALREPDFVGGVGRGTGQGGDVGTNPGSSASGGGNRKNASATEKGRAMSRPAEFARQVGQHANLKVFLGMFALQQFDCAFGKNFFPIFLEKLVGDSLSPSVRSITLSASFILPWVSTLWLTRFVRSRGLHAAVAAVLNTRVCLLIACVLALSVWHVTGWFGALALLLNRVTSEAICRLLPLVQTDLVDEDMYIHGRKTSMSASIMGAIGFFGKPSQSLAPMMGFALLAGSARAKSHALTAEQRGTMEFTFLAVPCVVLILQQCLWQGMFTLRGSRLTKVKNYIREILDPTHSV